MKKTVLVLGCFACFFAGINWSVQRLEGETIKQCREHDWPIGQHEKHIDWCIDNGYDVGNN